MQPKSTARFPHSAAAAKFYGISLSGFRSFRSAGDQIGDPLPVDDPAGMVAWFGRHKRPVPTGVRARAAEQERGSPPAKSAKQPKIAQNGAVAGVSGKNGVETAESDPDASAGLLVDEVGTTDEEIANEKRLCRAYNAEYLTLVRAGEYASNRAMVLNRLRMASQTMLLSYAKNSQHTRDASEYVRLDAVKAAAAEFAVSVARLLRRHLPMEFADCEHEKIQAAIDRLAVKLPGLLPKELV